MEADGPTDGRHRGGGEALDARRNAAIRDVDGTWYDPGATTAACFLANDDAALAQDV